MDKEPQLRRYSRMLEQYGFSETYADGLRSSFDIISSKKEQITILKLVDNIDSLSAEEASELKKLNNFYDANVFVVFKNYKGKKNTEKISFTRHGVTCVSHETFESILNGASVAKAQRFMKTKYRVNSNELKRMRKLYSMSIRNLSKEIGISKDSIYRYEKGEAFATLGAVKRLDSFFKAKMAEDTVDTDEKPMISYGKINDKLDIGFIRMGTAPFYMLAKKRFRYEIGSQSDARTMKKQAELYKSMANVLGEDYPFFITEKKTKKSSLYGVPVLSRQELNSIADENELIDLIASKGKQ